MRHWNKPRIENYLRITIGTPEQMEKLCEALEGDSAVKTGTMDAPV